MTPCLRVSVSPCLRVSVSPCLRVSVSPCLRVSVSPCLCFCLPVSLYFLALSLSISITLYPLSPHRKVKRVTYSIAEQLIIFSNRRSSSFIFLRLTLHISQISVVAPAHILSAVLSLFFVFASLRADDILICVNTPHELQQMIQ